MNDDGSRANIKNAPLLNEIVGGGSRSTGTSDLPASGIHSVGRGALDFIQPGSSFQSPQKPSRISATNATSSTKPFHWYVE